MPRYLNAKPLDGFSAINLSNVSRLDKSAVAALEKYVAEGGGAAFFFGELCQSKFFNQELYREGKGLFPLLLKGPAELMVDRLETVPDVQIEKVHNGHFLFRVFAEKRNSFLQSLLVQRYFAADEKWQPPADGSVRVLAKLRNGAPLIVEKSFGKGRVIAFLTTAAPTWNNWARNPGVVVMTLDLQAYLGGRVAEAPSRLVGAPLEIALDPAKYRPQVRFVKPREAGTATATTDAAAGPDNKLHAVLNETDTSGYYEAVLTPSGDSSKQAEPEIRPYAYNVEPGEGNLATLDQAQLAERLKGLKYQFDKAAAFQTAQNESTGDNLRDAILYALIFLLVGEQLLAYSASYHPALPKHSFAAGGTG